MVKFRWQNLLYKDICGNATVFASLQDGIDGERTNGNKKIHGKDKDSLVSLFYFFFLPFTIGWLFLIFGFPCNNCGLFCLESMPRGSKLNPLPEIDTLIFLYLRRVTPWTRTARRPDKVPKTTWKNSKAWVLLSYYFSILFILSKML